MFNYTYSSEFSAINGQTHVILPSAILVYYGKRVKNHLNGLIVAESDHSDKHSFTHLIDTEQDVRNIKQGLNIDVANLIEGKREYKVWCISQSDGYNNAISKCYVDTDVVFIFSCGVSLKGTVSVNMQRAKEMRGEGWEAYRVSYPKNKDIKFTPTAGSEFLTDKQSITIHKDQAKEVMLTLLRQVSKLIYINAASSLESLLEPSNVKNYLLQIYGIEFEELQDRLSRCFDDSDSIKLKEILANVDTYYTKTLDIKYEHLTAFDLIPAFRNDETISKQGNVSRFFRINSSLETVQQEEDSVQVVYNRPDRPYIGLVQNYLNYTADNFHTLQPVEQVTAVDLHRAEAIYSKIAAIPKFLAYSHRLANGIDESIVSMSKNLLKKYIEVLIGTIIAASPKLAEQLIKKANSDTVRKEDASVSFSFFSPQEILRKPAPLQTGRDPAKRLLDSHSNYRRSASVAPTYRR